MIHRRQVLTAAACALAAPGAFAQTAKPPIVVTADVKNARPVRPAAVSLAVRGSNPFSRSSR